MLGWCGKMDPGLRRDDNEGVVGFLLGRTYVLGYSVSPFRGFNRLLTGAARFGMPFWGWEVGKKGK